MKYQFPVSPQTFRDMDGQQRVRRGTAIIEQQEVDNGIALGTGDHNGFEAKKNRTTLQGTPGAEIKTAITVTNSIIIKDATLKCDGNTPAVTVEAAGRAILMNCHVIKDENTQTATDRYIHVKTGGELVVTGCIFQNTQAAGFVVDHDDAVNTNKVMVTGCLNRTTRTHQNVGTIQEVP